MRFHLHHLIINHNLRTHKHLPHHPCHVNQMLEINTKVDNILSAAAPSNIKVLPHRGRRLSELLSLSERISILL